MTQETAPMSPAIKFITGLVLVMTVAVCVAAVAVYGLLLGGAVLAAVTFVCYLYTPIAYELMGDQLTVRFRVGQKVFQAVTRCATLTSRPPMGLRLWGNGGLFAATGIFWNRAYGVYRAYVTSARYQDYVLVETRTQRILISPADPEAFVKNWTISAPGAAAPG
jgi:hypothetical protein